MPVLLTRCAFFAGLALLVLSLAAPWFAVPVAFDRGAGGEVEVVLAEANCTRAMKGLVGSGGIVIAWWCAAALRGRRDSRRRDRISIVALTLFFSALAFPSLVISRGSAAGEAAARLQMQHENLTWLGGDIYNAQEYAYQPRKFAVQLKDTPRVLAAFPVPVVSPVTLSLGDTTNIFLWAGYTPAFFQFAGKGWLFALFGSLMAAVSLCRSGDGARACRGDLRFGARLARRCCSGLVVMLAFILIPVFAAAGFVRAAERATAQGEHERARARLEAAIALLPGLRYHTDIVVQLGVADTVAGNERSPHALLLRAHLLEKGGYSHRATEACRELAAEFVEGESIPAEVAGEARRALLRQAMNRFNAGRIESAAVLFELIRAAEPAHLKVNYALQLAYLQMGKTDELRSLNGETRAVYAVFRSKNKRAVLSASHHNLAEANFDEGDVTEVIHNLDKMIRP